MSFLRNKLLNWLNHDPAIIADASVTNIRRMQFMAWFMGFINLVHIVIFIWDRPTEPDYAVRWTYLIIATHSLMWGINSVLGYIAYLIEKRSEQIGMISRFIQAFSIFANLFFGVLLCVSDQLVTTNINPIIIASIAVSVIFAIPPIVATVTYLIAFFIFYYLVSWTQHDPELLQHLRVNSISAFGLGLGISIVLWKNYIIRTEQKRIIHEQQLELEKKNRDLETLATTDPLTSLLNRARFIALAEQETTNIVDRDQEACLIMMDIDFFKQINDEYGHPAGDQILKDTSKIIRETIREKDIAARFGGEEFIILLADTDLDTGLALAERLRKEIEAFPYTFDGNNIHITSSFGVAALKDSFQSCYTEADRALYTAKSKGRNCVEVAHLYQKII